MRSSCEASATNWRIRSSESRVASSMALSASPRWAASLPSGASGMRRSRSPAVIASAACVISRIGASPRRRTHTTMAPTTRSTAAPASARVRASRPIAASARWVGTATTSRVPPLRVPVATRTRGASPAVVERPTGTRRTSPGATRGSRPGSLAGASTVVTAPVGATVPIHTSLSTPPRAPAAARSARDSVACGRATRAATWASSWRVTYRRWLSSTRPPATTRVTSRAATATASRRWRVMTSARGVRSPRRARCG